MMHKHCKLHTHADGHWTNIAFHDTYVPIQHYTDTFILITHKVASNRFRELVLMRGFPVNIWFARLHAPLKFCMGYLSNPPLFLGLLVCNEQFENHHTLKVGTVHCRPDTFAVSNVMLELRIYLAWSHFRDCLNITIHTHIDHSIQ